MRRFASLYDQWLRDSPLLTKSLTSAALFGLGDRIAQKLEPPVQEDELTDKNQLSAFLPASIQRTSKMMIWGGLMFAPIAHGWYNFLDRFVKTAGKTAVVQKIAMDQLIFTPPISLAFFTTMQCMDGKSVGEAVETANGKLLPTLRVNWLVWPLIHVCTFGFVPLQYRILFINCMSIGWSAFLSQMSNRVIQEDSLEEKEPAAAL